MTALPLTAIGGYLGAGKTTLINRLLASDHGLRITVLVNDFGALNIDASLLRSASEDTIELTNGCVCCAMRGDLFFAIGDILDRAERPDHLIVEASGIADPSRIAAVALAEPDLSYSGILTIVDGLNLPQQLADPHISDQVADQIRAADFIAVSKVPSEDPVIAAALRDLAVCGWISADAVASILPLVLGAALTHSPQKPGASSHPAYVHWSDAEPPAMDGATVRGRLMDLPPGLLRLKGIVPDPSGGCWEVHVVGTQFEIIARPSDSPQGIVAIGLADVTTEAQLRSWWIG